MGWHLKSDTFSERRCRRLAGSGKTCYFPDLRCRRLADNGKINHEKGMFCAAARTFPFLNNMIKGYGYGQKKSNSDYDKGSSIIPCESGGSKSYFSLRRPRCRKFMLFSPKAIQKKNDAYCNRNQKVWKSVEILSACLFSNDYCCKFAYSKLNKLSFS